MRRFILTIVLSLLSGASSADPILEYLVNTGVPTGNFVRDDVVIPDTGWALNGVTVCPMLNCVQWLAGEFTLGSRSMLNGIEGYIRSEATSGGTLRVAIYSDGGDLPGTLLKSAEFAVPDAAANNWYGVDGLHWNLAAGTYWVAFEVPSDSPFGGGMRCCAPDPLGNEAYWGIYQSASLTWHSDDITDIGVRILGRALPEPGPLSLATGCLAGLILARRRAGNSAGPRGRHP